MKLRKFSVYPQCIFIQKFRSRKSGKLNMEGWIFKKLVKNKMHQINKKLLRKNLSMIMINLNLIMK